MTDKHRTPNRLAATDPLHAVQNGNSPESPIVEAGSGTTSGYALVNDPIYLITVAVFALITTGLPAVIGQFRFMPIIQTLSLAVFFMLALRRGGVASSLRVLGIWLLFQTIVLFLLVTFLPPHLSERAIADGFAHRQALLEWIYAAAPYPAGMLQRPVAYLIEVVGILVGTLLTGGLAGLWFFMRLMNFTVFSIATMTILANGPAGILVPLLIWNILRIAGYVCLLPVLAQPILTGQWNARALWTRHRRLIVVGIALLVAGLLLEPLLTPLWPSLIPQE